MILPGRPNGCAAQNHSDAFFRRFGRAAGANLSAVATFPARANRRVVAGPTRPAATQPAATRDHAVVPDDYFALGTVTECVISPDGRRVAYVEQH